MQIENVIEATQKAEKLSAEQIRYFINNLDTFSQEEITEWLRAVKKNGLTKEETSILTLAMAQSGDMLNWEGLEPTLDKHSSGGIGDKITLLFVPLIAACGINIPKLSGRALGITGGTIDKLESIPGFRTNLSINEIKAQVKKIGLAVSSAGNNLAPADKKLYAIRDVTDTIDSIPLVASSIMSKKLASGAGNILLDVKCGSGAFMKTLENAKALAIEMVQIGKSNNRKTRAVISNMDEPLGYKTGNVLEIKEVLEVLSGKEVPDLIEITLSLAKEAMLLLKRSESKENLKQILLGGSALNKFKLMIEAQGGTLSTGLKKAKYIEILQSKKDGYVQKVDALTIGEVVFELGAGRRTVSDSIDHSVGIVLLKKHGDKVHKNDPLIEIHAKCKDDVNKIKEKLLSGIHIEQNLPGKLKLIHEIIA